MRNFTLRSLILLAVFALILTVKPVLLAQNIYTLGTGTIQNGTTSFPTAYGQYWSGNRVQYLIPASELIALGASGGNLLSIAFDVVTPTVSTTTGILGKNLTNFTIRMGSTTASSLTAWATAAAQVYTTPTYVSVTGWNTHTFTAPYFWDGISNLIIETCFENYDAAVSPYYSYSVNAIVNQSTVTGYNCLLEYHSDNGDNCAGVVIPTTYTQRPNIRFVFAPNAAKDAGISAVTQPVSPILPGTAPVKVNLKNFGIDTITSASIGWSVNGVLQTPYTWAGSLPSSAADTNIQIGTYNFPIGTHVIKAWATVAGDTIHFNDTTTKTVICCNLLSGTYTIGATGADYPSFNAALLAVTACGINGPVTFNVLPGTYTEQVTINSIPGTSATNRVTFQSSTGNPADVILKYNAATGANHVFKLNGADYITVQYITMKAEHPTNARVIDYTGGANYNIINGNILISQPGSSSTTAGIYNDNFADDYNVISNNKIYNGYYGIYIRGSSNTARETGTIIENNLVQDYYYYGIYLYYINGPKVRGNTVIAAANSQVNYATYLNYCGQGLEVIGNRIECRGTSSIYALYLYYCDGDTSALVANNFIAQTYNNNTYSYGLYAYYSTNIQYYHNSIRMIGSSPYAYALYLYNTSPPVANNKFLNNIFVSENGGYAVYASGAGATGITAMDYNNIYCPSGSYAYWNTTTCANLAALQTASGMDVYSVSLNPNFISPAQLYPGSSALDNKGTFLTAVPADIDGKMRSLTTPDIGAAEFTIPPNDAGIVAINGPVSPIGPGSTPVSARFKNYGTASISNVTLNFSVNGSAPVSYFWAGSLAPDSTEGPVTIGNFNFPLGTNTLKVWTSSPNSVPDSNNINDTMVASIVVCQLLSGTYTIGDTTANYQSFGAAITAMTSCGVSGNVTFNVMPGTYTEQVTIPQIPGASLANRITFQSSTGNASDVILKYAPTSSGAAWVLYLNGADYITIQNMTIATADSGSTYGRTVMMDNSATYNMFSGNKIKTLISTSSSYVPLYSTNSGKEEYNIFINNTFSGGYYGIYWYGLGSAAAQLEKSNVFEANTVQDFYYYGAYFYYQDGVILNKNKFTNSTASGSVYGIYLNYCDNGIQVTKNRVALTNNGSAYPMYIYYCDGTAPLRGLIANNFLSFAGVAPSATVYGMYVYYSSYQSIYHNSVNVAGGSTTSRALYIATSTSYTGLRIKNNIFSNMVGGYAIYQSGANTSIEMMDYNNYYTTGANLGYWVGNQANLAAWQSISLMDSNSVSVNPAFMTSSLLYPLSFPMNNLGNYITDVPDDIDDLVRSLTTPDIGAAEYTPPTDDAGMTALHSPLTPLIPGTYPISVSFKNSGLNIMTSVKLSWKLDSLPVQTQLWVGYLLQDSTYGPQTLGNTALTYGLHTLKVWTSEPNNALDGNPLNDTITRIINVCDIMDSTYTIGDTLSDFPSFTAAVNAMLSCGIGATVTFNVKPGTYNEMVSIPEIAGASAANRVIFQSATGNPADVILTWNQQTSANAMTLRLNGADYITFRNMTIKVDTGTQTYGRAVVLRAGANYNIFENNIITTWETTNSYFAPVYSFDGKNEYNQFLNNQMNGGYYGVYLYGIGSDKGNVLSGNKIQNYYYYGIYSYYQDGLQIKGNKITNAANSGYIYALYGYYNSGGGTLADNIIKLTGTSTNYGLYINYFDGTSTNPLMIYNNNIFAGAVGGTVYTMYLYGCNYNNIYHNSLYIPTGSSSSRCLYLSSSAGINNKLFNNLIVNKGPGMGVQTYYAGNISQMDYNDYYVPNGIFGYWISGNVTSFTGWQGTTGMDTNSVNLDPLLMILNDTLTPTAFSLNDQGTPLASVTTDIAGKPRDPSTPDIGALEFSPLSYEAELVSAHGPAVNCDLGIEYLSIQIKNNGVMLIDSIYAGYQIAGGTPVVEVVQNNIASGATLNYTFTTGVNLATLADTVFNFRIAIYLPADIIHNNDSLSISVASNLSPPAPAVVNVTIPNNTSTTLHVTNPQAGQNYFWYATDTSLVELAKADTFVTPVLSTTTVYWVASMYGSGFSTYQTGPGTTTTIHSPSYGWYDYSWSGSIYLASELSSSGGIDSVGFYVNNSVTGYTMLNQKVYMAHTTDLQWPNANKPDPTTMTQVYNGTVTWNPGWNVIPLSSTFNYNGTSNLIVYWENWDGSYVTGYPSFSSTPATGNMTVYDYEDGAFPTVAGAFEARPDIRLVGSGNGCPSDRVPDTVFVLQPVVSVNAGPDLTICAGDTAQLAITVSGGVTPYTYSWSPATSLTNATIANPKAFPVTNTTYSVTVTDQNGETGTDGVIVTVTPSPLVTMPPLSNVCDYWPPFALAGGSPAGGTYSGAGISNNMFNPGVAGTGNHTITYSYTNTSTGCTGHATQVIYVDPCVGIEETGGSIFELYPNPASDLLNIVITGINEPVKIRMMNVEGQVVYNEQLLNSISTFTRSLDVSKLPAGVYYIRLEGETTNIVEKVVIE